MNCSIQKCTFNTDKLRLGLCRRHYISNKKYGDPLYIQNKKSIRPSSCKVQGCNKQGNKPYLGKEYFPNGYCKMHYLRLYRNNKLEAIRYKKLDEKHGMAGTKLYISWQSMIRRCYDSSHKSYRYYGYLGISVCDRWRYSFKNFYQDMGDRPEGMTLDRIDPYGNYEPANCRWATWTEQNTNKRKTPR